uniref:Cathepsin L n=1 Tax=Fasciola hepatica TaxID=6192 RepID=A3FMG6_FASHE|nr:cathepsin L [Fasciola hepatica]
MWFFVLAVLTVGVFASNDDLWHQWKRIYNKEYNGADDEHRRNIWGKNVKHIQEHNLRHDLGLVTYKLGLNQFTDLTFEEFKAKYLIEIPRSSELLSRGIPYKANKLAVPESIDWRDYYYVTEVKNQGQCGSCWAFSTTGAVEGQFRKNERASASFSEQQLVNCTRDFGNYGCGGGYVENAYEYLKHNGLETESYYPYQAVEGPCQYDGRLAYAKVTGYYTVHSGDEIELKNLVGTEGPAAVALDADSDFMMYQSGIYQSQTCLPDRLTHAVLAVGYGSQDGTDYWIVKNSWGTWWGEDGYIRFARNRGNMCGIASLASVPIGTISV